MHTCNTITKRRNEGSEAFMYEKNVYPFTLVHVYIKIEKYLKMCNTRGNIGKCLHARRYPGLFRPGDCCE